MRYIIYQFNPHQSREGIHLSKDEFKHHLNLDFLLVFSTSSNASKKEGAFLPIPQVGPPS